MAFRDPVYLDLEKLKSIADYHGVPINEDAQVTRTSSSNRSGRLGVSQIIDAGGEAGSSAATTEVFTATVRPVRAFNDTIDTLLESGGLVDFTSDPGLSCSQRDIVQFEGESSLSEITEVAAFVALMFPGVVAQMAAGVSQPILDSSMVGQMLMSRKDAPDYVHVYLNDGRFSRW